MEEFTIQVGQRTITMCDIEKAAEHLLSIFTFTFAEK